jgi:hypothetical protein
MSSAELDNLVRIGKLKREPPAARELQGLLASARERLTDADNATLAFASLDVIISVGCRVKSVQGTRFRIWATQVVREHLVRGYTVNRQRLHDPNQSMRLFAATAAGRDLSGDETQPFAEETAA